MDVMKLTKVRAGSYHHGNWCTMRVDTGSWIVWNLQTQTTTARECPRTRWFVSFADAKKYLAGVE